MDNCLNIQVPEIKEARTELEYCFRVVALIHHLFPKGYIEWKALCYYLYGTRGKMMTTRLKEARFEVNTPIVMNWKAGNARVFSNKIVFALCVINKCTSFERIELFESAYDQFVKMKEEGE